MIECNQELAGRAACDITGGSGAVHVGMYMWLVQAVMMPQRADPLIGQEQVLYRRAACDVTSGSGAVQVGMDTLLVLVLMISLVAEPVIVQRQEMAGL